MFRLKVQFRTAKSRTTRVPSAIAGIGVGPAAVQGASYQLRRCARYHGIFPECFPACSGVSLFLAVAQSRPRPPRTTSECGLQGSARVLLTCPRALFTPLCSQAFCSVRFWPSRERLPSNPALPSPKPGAHQHPTGLRSERGVPARCAPTAMDILQGVYQPRVTRAMWHSRTGSTPYPETLRTNRQP